MTTEELLKLTTAFSDEIDAARSYLATLEADSTIQLLRGYAEYIFRESDNTFLVIHKAMDTWNDGEELTMRKHFFPMEDDYISVYQPREGETPEKTLFRMEFIDCPEENESSIDWFPPPTAIPAQKSWKEDDIYWRMKAYMDDYMPQDTAFFARVMEDGTIKCALYDNCPG